ncbi:MAG: histidine kinase dimerization/phospho-acceptor domain-containing protein [Anaeromyxobacteraceae bacterium]
MPTRPANRQSYRAFLASRWAPRARTLAARALVGTPLLLPLDVLLTRGLAEPPGLGRVAAIRLASLVFPSLGWLVAWRAPRARWLPAVVVALSVAWSWYTDWSYPALGLGGTNVQAIVVLLCFITAATFIPVRLRGRLGVFALIAAGHLAIDLGTPQARSLAARLVDDVVLLALVAVQTVVFEQFAESSRRRFILHHKLEAKVFALDAARRGADRALAKLGSLAARVAHEINNPLAAIKVNVRWLSEPHDPAERGEVVADTLEAVDRIARSVADLEAPAVTPAPPGRTRTVG